MHSSRMRTGRSLTVCRSLPRGGGVPGPGGGIPACTEADTPPEQNDRQVQKYYLGHNFVAAGKKMATEGNGFHVSRPPTRPLDPLLN